MRPIDRYIDEVLRNVFAAPEDRARLEADLRAHFSEAEARGEPPGKILDNLGKPEEVAAAFNAEREIRYAGLWQRAVAFAGDCGLLLLLALPLLLVVALAQAFENLPGFVTMVAFGAIALAATGVFVFYFPLLEARFGKTFGKHLMRIRVLRENRAPVGLGPAFVRRLSLYFKIWLFDALFIPFTERRQRALDIVAKTVVAREPGVTAPGWAYAVCLLLPVASLLLLALATLLCAPS